MQITVNIPDPLGAKLNALPDPQQFVVRLLTESLEGGLAADQWWALLNDIENVAIDTGISDLAERHDDYQGKLRRSG
jgi:hypothetical protein